MRFFALLLLLMVPASPAQAEKEHGPIQTDFLNHCDLLKGEDLVKQWKKAHVNFVVFLKKNKVSAARDLSAEMKDQAEFLYPESLPLPPAQKAGFSICVTEREDFFDAIKSATELKEEKSNVRDIYAGCLNQQFKYESKTKDSILKCLGKVKF